MLPLAQALLSAISLSLVFPGETTCELDCRKNPRHTTCIRTKCQILGRGVDAASRSAILKAHNDYRSQVARGRLQGFPPAADMQELLWDDDLARVAQAHAELCEFDHDNIKNRCTRLFEATGQNIGILGSSQPLSTPDWPPNIFGWFNESWEYPPGLVKAFQNQALRGGQVAHFTQVIWAKSRYVGCGFAYYHKHGDGIPPYKQLYTCNYGPSGNYQRQPVYQEGPACTACPPSTSCNRATGLCGDGTKNGAGGSGGRDNGGGGGRDNGDGGRDNGGGDRDSGGGGHDDDSTTTSPSWVIFVVPFLLGMMIPVGGWASFWWYHSRKQGAANGGAAPIVPVEEPTSAAAASTTTSTN